MKKLILSRILSITKFAFMGLYLQCLFGGMLWAADTKAQQQRMKENFLTTNNAYINPKKEKSDESSPQQSKVITGKVTDSETQESLPGVNIVVKGSLSGTVTDLDGNFRIQVPSPETVLVFSAVGYVTEEIIAGEKSVINIALVADITTLGEIVIVGYGEQKKESVVGAITQTSGKVLERTGGVSSLGAALTGNLPGVITYSSSGMPGAEDPKIIIRTQTSWNNSDPLVLVDGVERPISTVDISSVESVSVLKDASATAVYGVKGANGVILITTKRGKEGKANIQIRANTTMKLVSKLPEKYDAYDALMLRNLTIERELPISPTGWGDYTSMDDIYKYRYPANDEEWDRYPNVDWEEELFKDYAMSYNLSTNVSGGTKFVNYFAAIDLLHEGDLFKKFDNNRGYNSGYGYNRINVRSNLDFNLTKTTKFSTNLFGSNGLRKLPWGARDGDAAYWSSAYRTAPDAMRPIYSDGTWGYYDPRVADVPNSVQILATSGVEKRTYTQINTDFKISQELDMLTKGLDFNVNVSLDNSFKEKERGINDLYNYTQRKWVNPVTGDVIYEHKTDVGTQLDFSEGISWTNQGGNVDTWGTYRKLYYSTQLNYAREFDKHEVTAMGLFSREKQATGNNFYSFREDWAFRGTYNYAKKYFIEMNGAYNGSEKYGPNYRFAFFPSFSGGWMISQENFASNIKFLDMLKVRGSWGRIGDDKGGNRFLYVDQWAYGGNTVMGSTPSNTPYTFYRISQLGNPNISWESVEKLNFGVDYSFLDGLISGSLDVFKDNRTDIVISNRRNMPSYFGEPAPTANLGEAEGKGYEFEIKINKEFNNGLLLWGSAQITHAINKTKISDSPELLDEYLKKEGYAIGQTTTYIDKGFINSWDDLYGSTERNTSNETKIPGDYNIVDFNGDGIIDTNDKAPYEYSGVPQNTFNTTLGFEWKGLSGFVQFYGVCNVTRDVPFPTFHSTSNVAYVEGTYWSANGSGEIPYPRWTTNVGEEAPGTRYLFDGSYLRLKNAEIAYTFNNAWIQRIGVNSCKIYLNGSNLLLWTDMPDDRESNFSGSGSFGAYPTVKRFNLGLDITL